jgi:hypothetical protein
MTDEEKVAWENLYYYVKSNIMGYDENQALSSTMVLSLKGLLTNKFMENNNIESTANYSYVVILNTFKFCSQDIQRALRTGNFKDEHHKFNYILKIVEKNINTVYMKMKGRKKVNEEIETVDTTIANYVGVEYKAKESKKDKFSDLW